MKYRSTQEIINCLKAMKPELQKKYPITSLGLFGSYARGDFNAESDIDILVEFDGKVGLGYFKLANELEDVLGLKVDVVSRNGIKPHYLPYIDKNLILV